MQNVFRGHFFRGSKYLRSNPGSEYVLARNPSLNVLLSVKEGWGVLCNNQKEFREDKESKTIMNKT